MFQILKMTIYPSRIMSLCSSSKRIVSLCSSSKPYTSSLNTTSESQGPWTEFGRSLIPLPKHWFLLLFFFKSVLHIVLYWLSTGCDFAPWGHLAMSGDISGCHNWDEGGVAPGI